MMMAYRLLDSSHDTSTEDSAPFSTPCLDIDVCCFDWSLCYSVMNSSDERQRLKPPVSYQHIYLPSVLDDESRDDNDEYAFARPPSPNCVEHNLNSVISPNKREPNKRPRRVSFAPAVEICTYEVILGVHPFCDEGMALECGWAHSDVEVVDLEVYEQRSRHRPISELYLDFFARQDRLSKVTGMTPSELFRMEYELYGDKESLVQRVATFP